MGVRMVTEKMIERERDTHRENFWHEGKRRGRPSWGEEEG